MLPDRERDILRVQAKNLVLKLRKEHQESKLEGREDATTRKPRVPGTERPTTAEETTSIERPSEEEGRPG